MAEPPYKRARRPDSKQMWDEADRRAPQAVMPSRERDDRGGDRREDRNRDRDRRYRSRSPRDSRGGGGGRDSAGRRDERDRGTREGGSERGGRREYRDRERDGPSGRARDGGKDNDTRERDRRDKDGEREGRDRPRERSKDRPRDSDRYPRSRSPRRERERDSRKEVDVDKNIPKPYHDEEEYTKARTATPPVSFRVSNTAYGQDDEHMEVDEETKPAKKGKKGKKVAKPVEDDDDLIVEDDGMAAMQAMMGFGGFGTTHQQKVAGNDIYAVRKEKKTEYRQYMNRVGGFNRPLSPSRES